MSRSSIERLSLFDFRLASCCSRSPDTKSAEKNFQRSLCESFRHESLDSFAGRRENLLKGKFLLSANNFGFNPSSFAVEFFN